MELKVSAAPKLSFQQYDQHLQEKYTEIKQYYNKIDSNSDQWKILILLHCKKYLAGKNSEKLCQEKNSQCKGSNSCAYKS